MIGDSLARRKVLYGIGAASVTGLAGCSSGGSDGEQELSLRVGTSAGGTQDVGLAVERAVSQESDNLEYSTIESPGYIGTIRRMANGQFNAGITDNNSLAKALDERGAFAEQPVERIPQYGFYAFPYSIYIIARDGTGIETFDDLAGADVYPAEPGYSTRATTLDVWSQEPTAEIYEAMNIQDMGVDSAAGAVEEGDIDACIAYGTPGVRYTGWVQEVASRTDVHYVEPTDALIESAESYSGAGTGTTNYENWSIGDSDIGTEEVFHWDLEVNYTFNPEADPNAVYELCRIVDEHNDVVNEGEEQFNDFTSTEDMLGSARENIPVHRGAVEYYQENNAWDSSLQEGNAP